MLSQYKEMTVIQLKNAKSCLFWKDKWSDQTLQEAFPKSFSFAKNKSIAVQKAFNVDPFFELFSLPLSEIAFSQVESIQQKMEATYTTDDNDIWTLSGGSANFSSAKAYKKLIGHHQIEPVFKGV